VLPQKILEFFELPSSIWGYFGPYHRLELEHFGQAFAMNLRAQRKVTVVLTANTHTLRSGEHTDHVILKIQIAILRSRFQQLCLV